MGLAVNFKRLFASFRGIPRRNEKTPETGQELRWIMVSGLPAFQNSAYLDSFTTGLQREELEKQVHYYWNVYDRQAALEIITRLLKRNRNENLRVLYEGYEVLDYADYFKFRLKEDEMEVVKKYIAYFDKLLEEVPELLKKEVFPDYAAVKRCQDSGWNLGRAAFLARCCYDIGYIDLEELKRLLKQLYQELQKHCKTWSEYTGSYVLGRALEDRPNEEVILKLADKLLHHPLSPFKGDAQL